MTLLRRRAIYRMRNTMLDWVKLAAAISAICFFAAYMATRLGSP